MTTEENSVSATISQLRLDMASLEEKNLRLSTALVSARNQISGLQEQIERYQRPPGSWATFVASRSGAEADVIVGTRHMRVGAAQNVDLKSLSPGQLVSLDEHMVITAVGDYPQSGVLVSVLELVGKDRALVAAEAGQEHVVHLSGPLRHGNLKPGDSLLVDLRTGFAYERLVRSHVEQLFSPEKPDVSYADIGGLDQQIELVRDSIELPFRYPDLYKDYGLRPPRGVLLYGPPGSGKTLIAKAIAASLSGEDAKQQTYFISIKGPELLNKYVGETERVIRSIFSRARALARRDVPVVIFFDEIEALFRTRGTGVSSDIETMIVPQLLAEMDGLESLNNVVVIGASNRADMIDPALLRSGRFDIRIRVDRPTRSQARDIFGKHLTADLPLDPELVAEAGSPRAAVSVMIEKALDRLYAKDQSTELFELQLRNGRQRRLHLSDLVSGAMIAGTVERAKKSAIKSALTGESQGIGVADLLSGVEQEVRESSDLAATVSPEEWARTVGLRGDEVVRIVPINGSFDD